MPSWLLQYFLNPTFVLAGTALVASPIIIHLINRLRYRRVRFAAMEFLLASLQRNRKRVLLEQLLLLLLRILLVLGLMLLIARLILDPSQLSVFRGARSHHMVLLDDNFATIVAAVEEGRVIYDNIRKFVKYLLTTNSSELWLMLVAPFLGMPLPLLPLQILWINLVTDGPTALTLGVEPAERGVM